MRKISICLSSLLLCGVFCALPLSAKETPVAPLTPSKVVLTFYKAMSESDFATARKYIKSQELQKMIQSLEALVKELPDLKADIKKDFLPYVQSTIVSEKITGDKAKVTISYVENGKKKQETIDLLKVNGQWLIVE